jgi:NADPH:quinone reductase-like Zn-dependent oxidoreductase
MYQWPRFCWNSCQIPEGLLQIQERRCCEYRRFTEIFKANPTQIMGVSTDYRDPRKGAYQEYAVVADFNACKLPPHITPLDAAPLGVAFVAAALALGICMGVDFSAPGGSPNAVRGPNLLHILRSLSRTALSEDIRSECFDGIKDDERAKSGDWIVIWGGSCVPTQLIWYDANRL